MAYGNRRAREFIRVAEMLEAADPLNPPDTGTLRGYQIIRPSIGVAHNGPTRQLAWAIENWIRPYLNRVRQGIEYDPKLHRPPAEPDWLGGDERGRGHLKTRLKHLYGDGWESNYLRKKNAERRERKLRARRRARD